MTTQSPVDQHGPAFEWTIKEKKIHDNNNNNYNHKSHRSADAMDVVVNVFWEIIIQDKIDAGDVQTAGSDVCGYQKRNLSCLEGLQGIFTLLFERRKRGSRMRKNEMKEPVSARCNRRKGGDDADLL